MERFIYGGCQHHAPVSLVYPPNASDSPELRLGSNAAQATLRPNPSRRNHQSYLLVFEVSKGMHSRRKNESKRISGDQIKVKDGRGFVVQRSVDLQVNYALNRRSSRNCLLEVKERRDY